MIPWFLEREPTSSFFQEDVEVGVITWGHEFLGSVHRFLGGRCLNLGLVNEFQAFMLSLLIEGSKSFHSVLEHVTGARAMGELHGSHLPIHHGVVLLQPQVAQDQRVLS